jgi:hypothetical protein
MIRHVALWLAFCMPAFGHELVVDVEVDRPIVSLRASYGPGEPAAHVAVAVSSADEEIGGETDAGGAFTFTPRAEGEWQIQVDDGYGHLATRTVVVNWAGPAVDPPQQTNIWAKTGAGLFVIFGLTTAFVFWGRRRVPNQRP